MNRGGASIVEVLFASVLLASGLASVAGLTGAAARTMTVAWALEDATAVLVATTDSLAGVHTGSDGERERLGGRLTWSVGPGYGAPGWVRFDHPALGEPIEAAFLTRSRW